MDHCPECGAYFGRGTRSDQQNKAIHLFCQMLADAMNDAGLTVSLYFKDDTEIPWTQEAVKELIWRRIQKAMLNKKSTTQLNKMEVSDIYETINLNIAGKHGIFVPFPAEERGL